MQTTGLVIQGADKPEVMLLIGHYKFETDNLIETVTVAFTQPFCCLLLMETGAHD